jgi:hypothetical protein
MIEQEFEDMLTTGIQKTLKQGKACTDEIGDCVYTQDGLHCIIGNMMTPEELTMHERDPAGVYGLHKNGWKSELDNHQMNILTKLQRIHDRLDEITDPVEFRLELLDSIKIFAKRTEHSEILGRVLETIEKVKFND